MECHPGCCTEKKSRALVSRFETQLWRKNPEVRYKDARRHWNRGNMEASSITLQGTSDADFARFFCAAAAEQLAPPPERSHNDAHGLKTSHRALAGVESGTAMADLSPAAAAQGCPQHGLRGRASGSENAGGGTRPPRAATRHFNTTLGILSYAELAPHLAGRVEQTRIATRQGGLDSRPLDEHLFLDLHQRTCGELTASFSDRWRSQEVVAGQHHPLLPFKIAQAMRDHVFALHTRIEPWPGKAISVFESWWQLHTKRSELDQRMDAYLHTGNGDGNGKQ